MHGAVDGAIASGEIARALADPSPWRPAWNSDAAGFSSAGPAEAPRTAVRLAAHAVESSVDEFPARTCRICREKYTTNDARACRHHPGALRGESARKSDWSAYDDGGDGGDLVWTYTCCGQKEGAPGCVVDRHRAYVA